MVLGTRLIILLGLSIGLVKLAAADVTEAQATTAAQAFRLVAAKAGGTTVVGSTPATTPMSVDQLETPGCFTIQFDDGTTVVRKSDGVILKFSLDDRSANDEQWNASSQLTSTQLLSLAQSYRNQAGLSGTLTLVQAKEVHEATMYFDVEATLTASGVPYSTEHGCFFEISHTTGRLLAMELYQVPTAPSSVTPAITETQARTTFFSYLYTTRGIVSYGDIEPTRLDIWRPASKVSAGADSFLTSTHATMAANNQGLLAYEIYAEGHDTYVSNLQTYIPRFSGYVDAQTGQLLIVYQYNPFGGGGTGSPRLPTPDLGPGPLTISDPRVGKSIRTDKADLRETPTPKSRPTGRPVVLTRGRLTLIAQVDLATGYVWTESKGKRRYAKLDGPTLKALKKALK